jgi:DNA helicase-2/ATP-dependent DNA helicase PcrA
MFRVLSSQHPRLSCQKDKVVWSADMNKLIELRKTGTIRDVIELLIKTSYPRLSSKVVEKEEKLCRIADVEASEEEIEEADKKFAEKIRKLRDTNYSEVINLYNYIEERTPFSTKHGVKGAEFDEVLLVCGRGWNHYDWNKLLEWFKAGGAPKGKEDAFERNRNLFYVSCSRAKKRLALLFTQKLSNSALIQAEYLFGKENILGEPFKKQENIG